MKFVTYATYVADREAVDDLRPAHFEYMAGLLAEGKLAAAGSFADGSGGLFIYDMESFEDAKAAVTAKPGHPTRRCCSCCMASRRRRGCSAT